MNKNIAILFLGNYMYDARTINMSELFDGDDAVYNGEVTTRTAHV